MTISRRSLLLMGTASIAALALPVLPAVAPAATVKAAAARLPVWLVGSPEEFNWLAVRAKNEYDARMDWVCQHLSLDDCENGGPPRDGCDCEFCGAFNSAEAERKPALDNIDVITPADWLRNDMGHVCSRCGEEAYPQEGGYAVIDEAVCEECMELDDWEIVDPDRAARMRADLAEEDDDDSAPALAASPQETNSIEGRVQCQV